VLSSWVLSSCPALQRRPYLLAQDLVEGLEASEDDWLVRALHTAATQASQVGTNANCAPTDQGDGEAFAPGPETTTSHESSQACCNHMHRP
jgi:hypothetical protein